MNIKKILLATALATTAASAGACSSIEDEMTAYLGATVTYEKYCGEVDMGRAMQTFLNRFGRKKMNAVFAAVDPVDSVFVAKAHEQRIAQIGEAKWCAEQTAQWKAQFGS
jgi:hypothetical protein